MVISTAIINIKIINKNNTAQTLVHSEMLKLTTKLGKTCKTSQFNVVTTLLLSSGYESSSSQTLTGTG